MSKSLIKSRKSQIAEAIAEVFEETSGIDTNDFEASMTFLEMGLDSLVLTQTASAIKKKFGVEVTFRQMLEETPTLESLTDCLDQLLPANRFEDQYAVEQVPVSPAERAGGETPPSATEIPVPVASSGPPQVETPTAPCEGVGVRSPFPVAPIPQPDASGTSATHAIIQNQLQLMQAQLQLLGGTGAPPQAVTSPPAMLAATDSLEAEDAIGSSGSPVSPAVKTNSENLGKNSEASPTVDNFLAYSKGKLKTKGQMKKLRHLLGLHSVHVTFVRNERDASIDEVSAV